MSNLKIYILQSSHWDREWYSPFQTFRYNLVEMLDQLVNILENDKDVLDIVKENNYEQISDDSFIKDLVKKIVEANPSSVTDFKEGKDRAVKYLMGQIMKESKGQVNPALANTTLIDYLKTLI